jgi:putative SOS response-associated peptidase YedK
MSLLPWIGKVKQSAAADADPTAPAVRKVKEGETTNDIFAFLTTEPNAEVGAIHAKAMPVILTTSEEIET